IFKTTDAGGNWSSVSFPSSGQTLAIDPTNPNTVYVGTGSYGIGYGIYKSTDGGTTWNAINQGLNNRDVRALAIDPSSPARVYAGTGSGTDAFAAKLNAMGSALVYSIYLGGSDSDWARGIAVDSSGNAYLAGSTISTDFPTVSPLQAANGGF